MAIYKIAEINILINPIYGYTKKQMEPFICGETDYEFDASATREEIERSVSRDETPVPPALHEGPIILTKICRRMLEDYDGFFFHSSSLCLNGEGYLFTALSGTGKSTHTSYWRELFGGKVTMINDDKPIIRKIDGKFYVCSTPWMGKSNIGTNLNVPVKAVYVLKRGDENRAEQVSPAKVFRELLEATLLPDKRENTAKLLELYDGLFSQAKLVELYCKPEIEAAKTAYNAVNEEKI